MARRAKVVAFSTTPEMAEQIDRVATAENRTRSELLREAFRLYARRGGDSSVAQETAAAYAGPPSTPAQAPPTSATLPGFELVRGSRAGIKRVCRARDVARLWVFGSAVRDDFDVQHSDIDFIVEWLPGAQRGPWLSHLIDLEADLAQAVGRPVDVIESDSLRNRRLSEAIEGEKVLLYESA